MKREDRRQAIMDLLVEQGSAELDDLARPLRRLAA